MKIDLDNMVFIFKGIESKAYGKIPAQIVTPHKINIGSRRITSYLKTSTGSYTRSVSYMFDRFIVCDKNDAAYVLYGDNKK